jgi:hypothetical protein
MGKSFRKRPIIGNAADTDKYDKQQANRRLRHKLRQQVKTMKTITYEKPLPILREVSDEWSFNKDGKHYVDPEIHKEAMRK